MDRSALHSLCLPRTSLHKLLGRLKAKRKKRKFQSSPVGFGNNMSNPNSNIIFIDSFTEVQSAGDRPSAGKQLSLMDALDSVSPSQGRIGFPDPLVGAGPVLAPMSTRRLRREYVGNRTVGPSGSMPFLIADRSSSRGFGHERRDSFGPFAPLHDRLNYRSNTTSRPALGNVESNISPLRYGQRMPTNLERDFTYPRSGHNRRNAMTIYPSDYSGFDLRHSRRHPSVTTLPHYRSASAYARDPGGLPPAYDEVFGGGGRRGSQEGSLHCPPEYRSLDGGQGAAPVPM
ncbi:hypothetical protein CERZMDRAFT_85203 [Cercospora zeae-maydis SCOH1-5]|uniref:Uncharacterized protein n=1 Tax=Cercospora zeae-maydis SCOH1-5 TaxID=717836 RepID=A0A6A6FED0_9PEZI|nr:hypothetical protein CERZMDRAFT_85203 [Cercospora zeae-maydis SCOH1-5]